MDADFLTTVPTSRLQHHLLMR